MKEAYHYPPEKITELFGLRGKSNSEPVWNGKNLIAICPFPHVDKSTGVLRLERNPSFAINLYNGYWVCKGCGRKGLSLDTLAWNLGIELPTVYRTERTEGRQVPTFTITEDWWPLIEQNQEIAEKYLAEVRGITNAAEIRQIFHIGASREADVIYFPIQDRNGTLVGWTERHLTGTVRWINQPPDLKREQYLYGLIQARLLGTGPDSLIGDGVFLVESPADVLKLTSFGQRAVATFGAGVTHPQLELVLDHYSSITLVPDRDAPGDSWLKKCLTVLHNRCGLYVMRLPDHRPDCATVETFEELKRYVAGRKQILRLPDSLLQK